MTRRRRVLWSLLLLALGLRLVALAQSGCTPLRPGDAWRETVRTAARPAPPRVEPPTRWVRRFTLPAPYREASDLASTPRGLVASASIDALTVDGAVLVRHHRGQTERLLTWEGQGFLRAHAVGDTLLVPDADAPFRALPFLFDLDVDGYVFVSAPDGTFARSRRAVIPAVYHVFDTARLADGRVVASTGAYRPEAIPYVSRGAPAALFVDAGGDRPWRRVLEYPDRDAAGVWRFTFLHALDDGSLLAGVESPRGPGAVRITGVDARPAVHPVADLRGYVLRWVGDGADVYAFVLLHGEPALWRSRDRGVTFSRAAAPYAPQNLVRAADRRYLLADGILYARGDDDADVQVIARNQALTAPVSSLVSVPLVAHDGHLWAASPHTGEVFEAMP